jgi:hypothetical protein
VRGNGGRERRQERKRDVGDREPQREQESKRAGQRETGERQRIRPCVCVCVCDFVCL